MSSSQDTSRIPVKNIFYMLAYAWDHPHEKRMIDVYGEDEKDIINLLSKILISKVKSLIKRGFYREYQLYQEKSGVIRGKLLFKESIESFAFKRGKMHIQHEDLTYDILHNQLIKATMIRLSIYEHLKREYYDEFKRLLMYFQSVSRIQLQPKLFYQVNLHRNNQHYRFILNICQFIYENVLLHEGTSDSAFNDFSRDHRKLARLFEEFVKNFYKSEIEGSNARSEKLEWGAMGENTHYVPSMITDISLESADQKYIIDTKFYHHGLIEYKGKDLVRSGHLYQLYSYLENDRRIRNGQRSIGILLYPRVNQSFDLDYQIQGFNIKVCSVDLAVNWRKIERRLMEIIVSK